ncbi:hypothetical protein Bca52824_041975 [Brassica carinata]|uniref:NUC153 domain-containing protein n=1 Tax=Brassica carinata TaxID=52824 RepID=A0A8X7UZA4_BRACI|nr:hypothetical protein Bca52824_041975 [Brassica carinata]
MGSKRNNQTNREICGGGGEAEEEGNQMITDLRFSWAHTHPSFRRVPRRVYKVTIGSRFKWVLSVKASCPVDKRGKRIRRRRGCGNDFLKQYYRIEEDDEKKKQKRNRKEDSEEESGEQNLMALEAEAKQSKSEEESSGEEESKSEKKIALNSDEEYDDSTAESHEDSEEVSEEEGTDEDDGLEILEEIANIEKETHRLAIVNIDWNHITAKDLYVVLNSFLKKDGRVLSVAVYPTEFGLERMKHEETHGPLAIIRGVDKNNKDNGDNGEEEEEEEDEDVINERIREYEKSKFKYYAAVVECDSSATADYLYKTCDGFEFGRSSNKLDIRFIPDSTEFNHAPRDIATEAPANYQALDFQSQALQMSKVNVSWDEDEPHRVKTLTQKFNTDQLADLERFLASYESESDDDDDEEKRKTYQALMESGDVDSDTDDEENDLDMEFTFNTGLENVSKKFIGKKDKKSETLWETQLRVKREKKTARRMNQKNDDDNKKKKGLEEKVAAEERRSIAELGLIVADENGGDGSKCLKGYNIKGRKGKNKSREMAEEKIPCADPDYLRFSAAISDPKYALDPTDPRFKRSATYAKQLAQKQKEDPKSQGQVEAKEESSSARDGMLGNKKRSFAESATVESLKLKIQQRKAELAQRMKKKAKAN